MEALLKITHDRWHNINYIFFYHMACKKKKRTLNVHSGFSVVDNCSLIFLPSLFIIYLCDNSFFIFTEWRSCCFKESSIEKD